VRTSNGTGTVLCLASAAAFGAMGVLGKLAYGEGTTVGTLLSARFVIAAAVFWALVLASGRARDLRALTRRDLLTALALGAFGYAAQAGGFFAALSRIDASLVALMLYTYPALVAVAAALIGRERIDGRRAAALVLASGGLVLVLAGSGGGRIDALGAALAIGAACVYTTYILVGEGVATRVHPGVLSALVATGAAVSLTIGSAAVGDLHPAAVTATGWAWLACLALVSTVAAVSLFFAGLARVGPTSASILSTLEPVVTVSLAFVAFGEVLGPAQALGGALVLAAVPVLHLRLRRALPQPALADVAPAVER
jgi:drug/metabolite transporter (DMT)-like permease